MRPATPDPQQAEAGRIIAQAQAQAQAIVSRAEGAAQRLRQDAQEQATTVRDTTLASNLLTFNRRLRQELDEIRPLLVRMVIEGVEGIIGSVPEAALSEKLIRRALRDLETQKSVVLHAARADHAALLGVVESMARHGERTITTVLPDSDLRPGTCRLEAGGIIIELGLAAQLDVLEAMLLRENGEAGSRPSVSPDGDRTAPA